MKIDIVKNTKIEGLNFVPTIGKDMDDCDWFPVEEVTCNIHFSPCVAQKFKELFSSIKNNCESILEIGVIGPPQPPENAGVSTLILKELKNKNTIYLGVDIIDRKIQDTENNFYFLQSDSLDTKKVYDKIKELKIKKFDFIYIDGWHSVNMVIHEWKNYIIPFLSKKGIAVFHDVHTHPGPYALFEAVDKNIFVVEKYCRGNDWGLGSIKYKN
jgi:predicted O-methyltransferase YrrM